MVWWYSGMNSCIVWARRREAVSKAPPARCAYAGRTPAECLIKDACVDCGVRWVVPVKAIRGAMIGAEQRWWRFDYVSWLQFNLSTKLLVEQVCFVCVLSFCIIEIGKTIFWNKILYYYFIPEFYYFVAKNGVTMFTIHMSIIYLHRQSESVFGNRSQLI